LPTGRFGQRGVRHALRRHRHCVQAICKEKPMLIRPTLIATSEKRLAQANFSPTELDKKLGDGRPIRMSPEQKQLRRRQLLAQTDDMAAVQIGLERIIQGNDLDSINYLAKGTFASRSICRIQLKTRGPT